MTIQLLHTKDTAKKLGVSPRTMEKWRVTGEGPVFHKFGSKVFYAEQDLDAWVASRRRRSTSDPGLTVNQSEASR